MAVNVLMPEWLDIGFYVYVWFLQQLPILLFHNYVLALFLLPFSG